MKVVAYLIGRDEADNLPKVLESLRSQTLPFGEIIFIDDASVDGGWKIAGEYGATVIRLTERHPSYLARPEIATIYNKVFDYLDQHKFSYDYLMEYGADTILPSNYIEKMVERMEQNPKLVIAGGHIKGEYTVKTHVRGSGRLYKAWFWNRYIKRFPVSYTWESYPLYKAQALGLETQSFPDLEMETLRPTRRYKSLYGHAMRELGYIPIYALARCLMAFLWNPKVGVNMLVSYLRSPYKCYDPQIKRFIRSHQINIIKNLILHPDLKIMERLV